MIDILIYVAIALVVVVAALLAYAAAKPDTFRVQRSAGINTVTSNCTSVPSAFGFG